MTPNGAAFHKIFIQHADQMFLYYMNDTTNKQGYVAIIRSIFVVIDQFMTSGSVSTIIICIS